MKKVYISLGSNLENPKQQLQTAISHIINIPETTWIAQSPVLQTAPIGPQDQPDFYNQIVVVETTLSPQALLYALQAIENTMGRVRTQHWGPRVIDCDILLFGDDVIQTDALIIPHPEINNRPFVQQLLREVNCVS